MRFGIIGGTGVDEMECFLASKPSTVNTRWGSAQVLEARIDECDVVFLPRHGIDHQTPPGLIDYRAQIAALKKLDLRAVISVCAVGSLRADLAPGSFAVLSDFIDLTKRRAGTFFDSPSGPVVHTDFTQPYCPMVSDAITKACTDIGIDVRTGATYVGVEGPRYESPAEVRLYAAWGGDVIGMTNVPEVVLAREAGLCYGAVAVATNLASGISPTPLNHLEVRQAMADASCNLQRVLRQTIIQLQGTGSCGCGANSQLII